MRAVAEAARTHLGADWVLLALADGALPEARPRHLILDAEGVAYSFEGLADAKDPGPHLPDAVLNRLNDILRGQLAQFRLPVIESHHAHVPIELDGGVIGAFAAWTPRHRILDGTDETVMRILTSQTAVALQNCALFQTSQALLAQSQARYTRASRHAARTRCGATTSGAGLRTPPHRARTPRQRHPVRAVGGHADRGGRSELGGGDRGRPAGPGEGADPVGGGAAAFGHLRAEPPRPRRPIQPARAAGTACDRAHAGGPTGVAAGRRVRRSNCRARSSTG